jgi:dihydrofolate synthase/folylpolyglutamate synthase
MHLTEWLMSLARPGAPRGADAVALASALVAELDFPQRSAPAIHIVGTAGKGTVAALLTDRLVAAGLSVATHQSPHVDDVRERFLLNGELPDDVVIGAAREEVSAAIERVVAGYGVPPTFFAVTAAMSWVIGRNAMVDVFVTEAGIGGRTDATSVLDRSDTLTVITNIGLDHTDVLGGSVEAIAESKAGVLSGRLSAVLGPQSSDNAAAAVRAIARNAGVELIEVASGANWHADAIATVDAVADLAAVMLDRPLPSVVSRLPPGRMEVVEYGGRRWVLDGAHNPMKLAALKRGMSGSVEYLVAGIGVGKDLMGCGAALAQFDVPVIASTFDTGVGPRGWSAVELAEAVKAEGGLASTAGSIGEAVHAAYAATGPGATIVVTGSFLMLSAAREAIAEVG